MSSSNLLFLLLLLLILILPVFQPNVVRKYATRAIHQITRAPTAHEELPRTTIMSEVSIPRRDENDRWKVLVPESEAAIERYLFPKIDTDLASFIRCITFHVFLVVFLSVDPKTLKPANVQQVTRALSDFYDDRRGENTLPASVQSALYKWLPRERFPASLDRILPVYEALWRITATIVLICKEDEVLRGVMLDFRDNPRDRQYRASFGSHGKSASVITDEVVEHVIPIGSPQQATTSNWPLSCIQYASASGNGSTAGHAPTVQEGLKLAALLASRVIGRVGVRYGISGEGVVGSQASPWDQRRIFDINSVPGHIAVNVVEMLPRASTSRQVHNLH